MNSVRFSLRTQIISVVMTLLVFFALPAITNSQVIGNGYNNSLIYKIQSDTNTVYLLGSIHVLAEKYYPLTRAFSYSYYNSKKVVFEIDPEILFSAGHANKFEKQMTFQNGKTSQINAFTKNLCSVEEKTCCQSHRNGKSQKIQTLGNLSHLEHIS